MNNSEYNSSDRREVLRICNGYLSLLYKGRLGVLPMGLGQSSLVYYSGYVTCIFKYVYHNQAFMHASLD
jgi:hypothetical protein